jgi:hypothetical protein
MKSGDGNELPPAGFGRVTSRSIQFTEANEDNEEFLFASLLSVQVIFPRNYATPPGMKPLPKSLERRHLAGGLSKTPRNSPAGSRRSQCHRYLAEVSE